MHHAKCGILLWGKKVQSETNTHIAADITFVGKVIEVCAYYFLRQQSLKNM